MCLSVAITRSAGKAEPSREVRILAIRLLAAPPARLARDVHHRREHLLRTAYAHFGGNRGEHALGELGIPGTGERDRLREARGLGTLQAMQRLLVEEHGDAEPGAVAHPPLDRVGELRLCTRAVTVARPLDAPDADPEPSRGTRGVEAAGCAVGDLRLPLPEAEHLGDLLLQRHAPEQIVDAALDGKSAIPVRERGGTCGRLRTRHVHHEKERGRSDGRERETKSDHLVLVVAYQSRAPTARPITAPSVLE